MLEDEEKQKTPVIERFWVCYLQSDSTHVFVLLWLNANQLCQNSVKMLVVQVQKWGKCQNVKHFSNLIYVVSVLNYLLLYSLRGLGMLKPNGDILTASVDFFLVEKK